jgi:hypothetical protein
VPHNVPHKRRPPMPRIKCAVVITASLFGHRRRVAGFRPTDRAADPGTKKI